MSEKKPKVLAAGHQNQKVMRVDMDTAYPLTHRAGSAGALY